MAPVSDQEIWLEEGASVQWLAQDTEKARIAATCSNGESVFEVMADQVGVKLHKPSGGGEPRIVTFPGARFFCLRGPTQDHEPKEFNGAPIEQASGACHLVMKDSQRILFCDHEPDSTYFSIFTMPQFENGTTPKDRRIAEIRFDSLRGDMVFTRRTGKEPSGSDINPFELTTVLGLRLYRHAAGTSLPGDCNVAVHDAFSFVAVAHRDFVMRGPGDGVGPEEAARLWFIGNYKPPGVQLYDTGNAFKLLRNAAMWVENDAQGQEEELKLGWVGAKVPPEPFEALEEELKNADVPGDEPLVIARAMKSMPDTSKLVLRTFKTYFKDLFLLVRNYEDGSPWDGETKFSDDLMAERGVGKTFLRREKKDDGTISCSLVVQTGSNNEEPVEHAIFFPDPV